MSEAIHEATGLVLIQCLVTIKFKLFQEANKPKIIY